MKKPIVYAHRGASKYAPENTEAAFRMALEMNAGGIEIDVHLSSDGCIAVSHDERVNRTSNGTGFIKDMTMEELKRLDFGSWFSKEFAGERIMTLEELLELLKDWDGILNIELKSGIILYEGLERKVIDLLHRYDRVDRTIISSFNHYSLRTVKELEPGLKTGILYSAGLVEPWDYARKVGAEAVHPQFYSMVPQIIQGCRQHGIIMNPWTVDQPESIQTLALAGVDGIITNVPDVALQVVNSIM
jgi:glycerophosphoryl diester phosphodiesterase